MDLKLLILTFFSHFSSPGDYNINVKFADKDIPGSPLAAHIYSNNDGLDAAAPRPTVGKPVELGLEIPGVNLPEDYPRLTATLKRPSSPREEELKLVLNEDNTLSVAFTPREEGEHFIHLRNDNREEENSPFSVIVGAKEENVKTAVLDTIEVSTTRVQVTTNGCYYS